MKKFVPKPSIHNPASKSSVVQAAALSHKMSNLSRMKANKVGSAAQQTVAKASSTKKPVLASGGPTYGKAANPGKPILGTPKKGKK